MSRSPLVFNAVCNNHSHLGELHHAGLALLHLGGLFNLVITCCNPNYPNSSLPNIIPVFCDPNCVRDDGVMTWMLSYHVHIHLSVLPPWSKFNILLKLVKLQCC